ncbi:hypothetical protein E3E24_02540, partial [Thermococcus sp. LS2]|nr:hypothetical protein [Thermococcus sp. LS2]
MLHILLCPCGGGMSEKFEQSMFDYLKAIQKGEDILVEYTSNEPIHLIFYILLKYAKQNNIPVLIVDAVDQLHVLKAHLELAGIDTRMIDEVQVIKLGGIITTGKVLGRVDLEETTPVWKKHYDELLKKVHSDYTLRVIVGIDKVLPLYEETPARLEAFFGYAIRPYLGDKSRTSIYFLNTDIVGRNAVLEFEE